MKTQVLSNIESEFHESSYYERYSLSHTFFQEYCLEQRRHQSAFLNERIDKTRKKSTVVGVCIKHFVKNVIQSAFQN